MVSFDTLSDNEVNISLASRVWNVCCCKYIPSVIDWILLFEVHDGSPELETETMEIMQKSMALDMDIG